MATGGKESPQIAVPVRRRGVVQECAVLLAARHCEQCEHGRRTLTVYRCLLELPGCVIRSSSHDFYLPKAPASECIGGIDLERRLRLLNRRVLLAIEAESMRACAVTRDKGSSASERGVSSTPSERCRRATRERVNVARGGAEPGSGAGRVVRRSRPQPYEFVQVGVAERGRRFGQLRIQPRGVRRRANRGESRIGWWCTGCEYRSETTAGIGKARVGGGRAWIFRMAAWNNLIAFIALGG